MSNGGRSHGSFPNKYAINSDGRCSDCITDVGIVVPWKDACFPKLRMVAQSEEAPTHAPDFRFLVSVSNPGHPSLPLLRLIIYFLAPSSSLPHSS